MLADEKDIYNEITQYSEFADTLSEELNKGDVVSLEKKQKVLFPLIDDLKETGDKLIEQYVAHLNNKENKELVYDLRKTLDIILEKIDFCKNKVYELYKSTEVS